MDYPHIIELNQKAFKQLLGFVQAAEGFTIGFLEVNFKNDLDDVIQSLQKEATSQDIQWVILNVDNPKLKFLRDELVQKLTQINLNFNKKPVILLRGLEQSIGMTEDYPPILQDLNFVRDDYIKSVPYPVIFCLPDYAITRVAKYATDFWSWKSGLFRFQTRETTQKQAIELTLESDRLRGSLSREETLERIDLLQRLLMEYQPSGHQSMSSRLQNQFKIQKELGILYRNQGERQKAYTCFQRILEKIPSDDAFASINLRTLHELGYLYAQQGDIEEAITFYKKSLEIANKIGDFQAKASIIHNIAMIYEKQGNIDEAIALYKESLVITEEIGDFLTKSATLHQIAGIYTKQRRDQDALSIYLQALDITEKIGDLQGKAATLYKIAGVYANQGKLDDALSRYTKSLEITEKIGNLQLKASNLAMAAQLKAISGNINEAIQNLQKSLAIFQQLNSPNAQTVQVILNDMSAKVAQ